jgi:hypothetical protein
MTIFLDVEVVLTTSDWDPDEGEERTTISLKVIEVSTSSAWDADEVTTEGKVATAFGPETAGAWEFDERGFEY